MHIQQITLDNFKKFKQKTLAFSPGLNCIFGENEAGKSTLLNSLKFAFFGLRGDEAQCWSDTDKPRITITYLQDGAPITGVQSFDKEDIQLIGNDLLNRSDRAGKEIMTEHLGIKDAHFFDDTVFINQAQVAQIRFLSRPDDLSYFIPGLRQLIIAQKQINSQLDELSNPHPNVKHPRRFEEKKTQLAECEQQYAIQQKITEEYSRLKKQHQQQIETERELNEMRKRYESIIEWQQRQREIALKRENIRDELKRLQQIDKSLRSARQARDEYQHELESLQSFQFTADFAARADFLIGQMYRLEEDTSVHARVGGNSNQNVVEIFLWLAALMSVAGAIMLGQFLLYVIATLLLAIWGALFLKKSAVWGNQKQKSAFEKDRAVVLEQLREICPIFDDVNDDDPNYIKIRSQLEELQEKFARYLELKQRDDEARIRWEQTLPQIPAEWEISATNVLADLSTRRQKLEENLAELELEEDHHLSDAAERPLESLSDSLQDIKAQLPDILDKRIELETELKSLFQQMHQWRDVEGTMARLKSEISEIERQIAVLRKAEQGFQEAIQKLTTFPRVNQLASNYLGQISGHVYENCHLEHTNGRWQLEVNIPELKRYISPEGKLSYGTIEQIYLAFRLALADAYPAPLFFDDVLAHFDRKRQKNTLDLLHQLSKKRQIFITTHDPVVVKMLEKVAHLISL